VSIWPLARFATLGLPRGAIEITCRRCRTAGILRPADFHGGEVALSDQLAWARDHECRGTAVPVPEPGGMLARVF
jgi:hypothetical protein